MKAAFFDRDGVVNLDFGYVCQQKDFVFMEGIFELLDFFKRRDFLLFLVTNQSGIGMGYYSQEDFENLSDYMQSKLQEALGFGFDQIYFCPHRPTEGCLCRKPKPGMIEKAKRDYPINPHQSLLIGDKISDVQSAQAAGIGIKFLLRDPNKQIKTKTPGRESKTEQSKDSVEEILYKEALSYISCLYEVQTLKQIPTIFTTEVSYEF